MASPDTNVIRMASPDANQEIIRITPDDRVYMRNGQGKMVEVSLSSFECEENQ